jgi:hypothetical protein
VQTFDFSPLTSPVDRSAVQALRRESIAAKVQPTEISDVFALGVSVFGFILGSGMIAIVDFLPGETSIPFVVLAGYTVLMGLFLAVVVLGIVYGIYRLLVRWAQFYRAKQFAAVNGMTYAVAEAKPTWDGLVFNAEVVVPRGASVFTATTSPVFEAGNYHYSSRRPDGRLTNATHWGYIVVDLGRPVPPMVLRSKSRRSARRWALGAYSRNPILPLGRYADRWFRLYCPAGAEDVARDIFTPELVSRLRALGRSIDVEVRGSFLFVYSCKPFRFPRPRAVRAAFAIISMQTLSLRAA